MSGGAGTAKKTLQAKKEQYQTYRKTGQCTHVKQKPIGGLPFFAKLLMNQGFDKATVLLIMDAWRLSTKKLYTTYLNKWALFCVENKVKLLDPTLPQACRSLRSMSEGGYVFSELPQIIPRLPPPGGLLAGREGSFLWAEWVF